MRVQESEDGTSFVLEFSLDANDAGERYSLLAALPALSFS